MSILEPITTLDEANKAIRNLAIVAASFSLIILFLIFYKNANLYDMLYFAVFYITIAYLLYYHKSRTAAIIFFGAYLSNFFSSLIIMPDFILFVLSIIFLIVIYRGMIATFVEAKLSGRPTLEFKEIIKNIFVLSFWFIFSLNLIAFIVAFVHFIIGYDLNSFGLIKKQILSISFSITMPLISLLASFNKLPGVIRNPLKVQNTRKLKIFQNLFNFAFNRTFVESIGFFIVYLVFVISFSTFFLSLLTTFNLEDFIKANSINFWFVSFVFIALLIGKRFYKNPIYIIITLVGIISTYYAGLFIGLLIASYMTTIPAIKTDRDDKIFTYSWYHNPLFVLILSVFLFIASTSIMQSINKVIPYEEIIENPYDGLSKVFFSKKQKIYLKTLVLSPDEKIIIYFAEKNPKKRSFTEIAKYYRKSTVVISAFDKNKNKIGEGSGFIISSNGFIVTNYHVLSGAFSAKIELYDGRTFEDVYYLPDYLVSKIDVCVVKIDAKNLPTAILGDSDKALIGDEVITVGNPLGFHGSVSNGIISAFRDIGNITLMQITAPVSPGSSGGPVINKYGEVIGIITLSSRYGQNINFAVPINCIFGK